MNTPKLVGLVALMALVAGAVGGYAAYKLAPQLGGDFAGGVVPSNLWSANASTNALYPVGSFAVAFGGSALNNEVTALYTATTSYPASNVTLGPVTAGNSATTTQIGFTSSGFTVGDACEVTYNGGPTSTAFGADAFVTAVNGNSVTGTATFWNGSTASTTLTATSSATGASSTLKLTCFHTGV